MRGIWLAAPLVSLLVAGGGMAAAQETGAPSPFEEDLVRYRSFFDFGGFEPQLESLLPEGSASRWNVSAGVTSEYSDNGDQDGADRYGFLTEGTLGLGWLRRSPRWSGVADYSLGIPIHEEGAYDGEGSTRHALAGSLEWQASPRLRWNGAGHATQNLEKGLSSTLSGVRSNYRNRTDEYAARAACEWQASRTVENDTYYEFSYRDFASADADGEDTLSHRAGTDFGWQVAPRDGLHFGYAYSLEDQRSGDGADRQNHGGTLGWERAFLSFPGNRRSDLGLRYTADRGLFDGGDGGESDYWSHGASATYSWAPSPRLQAAVNGGYQWILPDDGSDGGGWTYGGRLAYRFTERTDGVVSYGESWEYTATSSTSDFEDLTRVRRAEARSKAGSTAGAGSGGGELRGWRRGPGHLRPRRGGLHRG